MKTTCTCSTIIINNNAMAAATAIVLALAILFTQAAGQDACAAEGQATGACFQTSWLSGCSYCEDYDLGDNPTCQEATDILCTAGFPDCCCGDEVVAVTECNIVQNRGENCVIDCANAGIGGSVGSVSNSPNAGSEDDGDMCEFEGRAAGTCFETAWMTACPYGRNYDLGDNPSCQKATDVLCEAGFSAVGTNDVCCGDEVVTVTQCNVMQNYGEECTVDCANISPKTNSISTTKSDSCDALGNEVHQCFQNAWHPWAGCTYW